MKVLYFQPNNCWLFFGYSLFLHILWRFIGSCFYILFPFHNWDMCNCFFFFLLYDLSTFTIDGLPLTNSLVTTGEYCSLICSIMQGYICFKFHQWDSCIWTIFLFPLSTASAYSVLVWVLGMSADMFAQMLLSVT